MGEQQKNPPLIEELLKKKTWEDFFFRTPCVRSSLLWGVGCGSLMVAHKLRIYRGNVRHAVNSGVLTFTVVASANFLLCADEINKKYDMIKKAFQQKKIQEDRSSKPPSIAP